MIDPATAPSLGPLPEPAVAAASRESTIIVCDLAESVRLMQQAEAAVIGRWRRFVGRVASELLPAHQARLVKSLGDGLMIEAGDVVSAMAVATALHVLLDTSDPNTTEEPMLLRVGLHAATVVVDEIDIYGAGVNLAARVAAHAAPGETLVTATVHDRLWGALDIDWEDLGERYLKHIDEPVRLYRARAGSVQRRLRRPPSLLPHLVVAPFRALAPADEPIARILTDDLVHGLTAIGHWTVMSRLSSASLASHTLTRDQARERLGADVLLSGTVAPNESRIRLRMRVEETRTGAMLAEFDHLLAPDELLRSGGMQAVVDAIAARVLARQLQLAHTAVLPSLPAYSLLLGAVALLHRLGADDARQAHAALEHLADRHPRAPEVRAWLAKGHFLQLAQGRGTNAGAQARAELARALELDPRHGVALALSGHLTVYAEGQLSAALARLKEAVQLCPNEPLGWLFLANALGASGHGDEAVDAIERACGLSPADPLAYYFDLFAASAYSAAGRHEESYAFALRSVRRNALHLSSRIQLILQQVFTNRMDDARRSVAEYLAMRPDASVDRFAATHVAKGSALAERDIRALLEAGLPH